MVGWRGAFVAAALLGVLAAAVMVLQRDALGGPIRREANRPPEEAANGEGWKLLFSLPLLRNLAFFVMLAITAGGMQNYSVVALGALYGTPLSIANAALSAYLLMISVGVLVGGLLASRTQRHDLVAVAGLIAVAITALAVGLVSLGAGLLIASMAIGGLFAGLIMPSRDMIVRSLAPPGSFGKVFGFVTTGFNLGGIVSPLLFGWLMDQGHPRAIFLLGACFSLLSIPTVLTFAARHGDQAGKHAWHLHDGVKRLSSALSFGPNQQIVTFVQKLRERVARIDRQRREHGKNFFLKIAVCPRSAFRFEFSHVGDADAVFR